MNRFTHLIIVSLHSAHRDIMSSIIYIVGVGPIFGGVTNFLDKKIPSTHNCHVSCKSRKEVQIVIYSSIPGRQTQVCRSFLVCLPSPLHIKISKIHKLFEVEEEEKNDDNEEDIK